MKLEEIGHRAVQQGCHSFESVEARSREAALDAG